MSPGVSYYLGPYYYVVGKTLYVAKQEAAVVDEQIGCGYLLLLLAAVVCIAVSGWILLHSY